MRNPQRKGKEISFCRHILFLIYRTIRNLIQKWLTEDCTMAELDSTEFHICDTPQFFFDNGMIEEIQNITRTIHRPEMYEGNPIIDQDRPWEHALNMHADDYKVWRDDHGVFHCLYSDFDIDYEKLGREGGTAIDWNISRFTVCYARSEDGLTWTKPPLGIREVDGRDTNIVFGSATIPLPVGTDSGTVYTTFTPHRRLRFVIRDAELYSFQIAEGDGPAER
jgi:hypothetical protein